MSDIAFEVYEALEGGLIALARGESIVTEAHNLPALRRAVRDAVHCHFEPGSAPVLIRLHAAGSAAGLPS